MSVKELITVPDDILRKKSEPLNKVDVNEKKLIKDLFETMYHHNGIGLAAVQAVSYTHLTLPTSRSV